MNNCRRFIVFIGFALTVSCLALPTFGQRVPEDSIPGFPLEPPEDRVVPGRFVIDPPTLENLGFRWYISGDSNRNASVAVSFRQEGQSEWREALPMLRVHHEVVNQDFQPYRTGNLFAGSVLFLKPGTRYEVRFEMHDPDGGAPPPKTVTVATRPEPVPWQQGRELPVFPAEPASGSPEGAIIGLQAALDAARPGDILRLHAGTYAGRFAAVLRGQADRPIVLRPAGDGQVVLQGEGHRADLLDLNGSRHVHLEHLTLRHARTAIRAGRRGEAGVVGLVVRRCQIQDVISGIVTSSENSQDWVLADNELTGINPTWYPRPGDNKYMEPSHTGINVYGQGIVVCHNRIQGFSDSLAIANFGVPVDDVLRHAVAIDFYGNDLSHAQDDCLEADYGCHNIRVYRNRCYNAHTGLSVQPSYGGPIYLIRNELFGITALSFKLHNYCAGIEAYHNTSCCAGDGFMSFNRWQNGHFRNNLILGGEPTADSRGNVSNRRAISTGTITEYSTLDYNGYRRNGPGRFILWYDGRRQSNYESLEQFAAATGHERHGILVDYDSFVQAAPPQRGVTTAPDQWDLRLRPQAVAVDRGCLLPTVNDHFAGTAPDLGCYELGEEPFAYGPR
jgi:hypothetical protein